MALTGPDAPPAPNGPPVPAWTPPVGPMTTPARPPAQVAVFGVCALAMVMVAAAADEVPAAIAPVLALVAGIATGLATRAHRLVDHVAGIVMALVAMVIASIGLVALGFPDDLPVPPITIVVVGTFVLGLDWRKVDRLRLLPFVSGVFVIPVVGMEQGWAYPAALAWLSAAVGALWLLQDDERAALPRPAPLTPMATAGPPAGRPRDVAGTLGLALALGVAAALLLGRPSCSSDGDRGASATDGAGQIDGADPWSTGQGSGGQGSGGQGAGGQGGLGEIPPERRSGGGSGGDAVGSEGGEREIPVREDGVPLPPGPDHGRDLRGDRGGRPDRGPGRRRRGGGRAGRGRRGGRRPVGRRLPALPGRRGRAVLRGGPRRRAAPPGRRRGRHHRPHRRGR